MARKQTLIHLHGVNSGKDVVLSKGLELGEIAVRNAADAKEAELYVANAGKTAAAVFATKDAIEAAYKADIQSSKEAIESGYTAADAALGVRIDNVVTAYTAADTALNNAITAETQEREADIAAITGATGLLNSLKSDLQGEIDAVADDLAAEVTARTEAVKEVADDLAAYKTSNDAAVKKVGDDLAAYKTSNDAAVKEVADDLAAEVSARTEAIEELQGAIEDAQKAATTKVVEGTDAGNNLSISNATDADGAVTYTINLTDVASAEALNNAKTDLQTISGKTDTLIGEDANKSVRTIANEELAAVLLNGADNGAEDNFKTLKEIADWIEKHPEDAAAMNTAIQGNKTAIENEVTARTQAVKEVADGLADEIEAREEAVSGVTSALETYKSTNDAAVDVIRQGLAQELLDRAAADTTLNNAITAETKARQDDIAEIEKTINGEGTGLSARIAALESGLSAETSARTDADTALGTRIDNVITAYTAADTALSNRIKTLEDAQATAATALQTVTVKDSELHKITTTKTGTNVEFNFDSMVINCGSYED